MALKSFTFTTLFLGISLTVAPLAQAQTTGTPVNTPPASFEGSQFVDNNGCVFIRAGFDGNVTWVPRVTRDRQPFCGQTPTFGATTAAAPAPVVAAAAPVAAAPVIAPRPTASVASRAPATVRAPSSKQVSVAPRIVRKAPAVASVTPRVMPVRSASASIPRLLPKPVQAQASDSFAALPGKTRIIPKHVYEQRKQELDVKIPYGYRPAWDDDRLNPHRAIQTVDGYNATQRIWTNTVPREGIATASHAPESVPSVVGRTKAHRSGGYAGYGHSGYNQAYGHSGYGQPIISARTSQPSAGNHYVRVGAFSSDGKARVAVNRLEAAGLPVRMGHGSGMTHVLVGPYASAAAATTGLRRTHSAGYVQAYLR